MGIENKLRLSFGDLISLEPVDKNTMRLYAPFFHEDGDMLSMYIELDDNGDIVRINDFGNTLMRVSYTFDLGTDNKQNVLRNIVTSNSGILDRGEIIMETDSQRLCETIFQYSQLVAKVSNIDILQREVVRSLFYDYLDDFVQNYLAEFEVKKFYTPTKEKELLVDYCIPAARPLFLFGVNENNKASKTIISCLSFHKQQIPFRSLVVHEDYDKLSPFNRKQIMNVGDKQFFRLDDFKAEGLEYIRREVCA